MLNPTSKGDLLVQELQQLRAEAKGQEYKAPGTPKEADVSFGDLVDIVNPLQHIPGVSTVYREVTGDEISGHARVAGGTLYGGPIGMLMSGLSAAFTEESGQEVSESMIATLTGSQKQAAPAEQPSVQMASAQSADPETAAAQEAVAQTPAAASTTPNTAPQAPTPQPAAGVPGFAAATAASMFNPGAQQNPDNGAPAQTTATTAATTDSTSSSGNLEGENALAAFARDMQAVGQASAQDQAQTARDMAAQSTQATPAQTSAAQSDSNPAAQQQASADYNFMPLSRSDYATSADMRARSQKLSQLQAQSMNEVETAVRNKSRTAAADGQASQSQNVPGQMNGIQGDFASRMKMALEKYRAMHGE